MSNQKVSNKETKNKETTFTPLCKYFNTKDGCKKGDNCPFFHPLCKYFNSKDGCKKGDNCHFSHPTCKYVNTATGCKNGENCKYSHKNANSAQESKNILSKEEILEEKINNLKKFIDLQKLKLGVIAQDLKNFYKENLADQSIKDEKISQQWDELKIKKKKLKGFIHYKELDLSKLEQDLFMLQKECEWRSTIYQKIEEFQNDHNCKSDKITCMIGCNGLPMAIICGCSDQPTQKFDLCHHQGCFRSRQEYDIKKMMASKSSQKNDEVDTLSLVEDIDGDLYEMDQEDDYPSLISYTLPYMSANDFKQMSKTFAQKDKASAEFWQKALDKIKELPKAGDFQELPKSANEEVVSNNSDQLPEGVDEITPTGDIKLKAEYVHHIVEKHKYSDVLIGQMAGVTLVEIC